MKLLYSNILPLETLDDQSTFADCFREQTVKSDRIEIAVGYVSYASLLELEQLAKDNGIGTICLNIGMYFIEGIDRKSVV